MVDISMLIASINMLNYMADHAFFYLVTTLTLSQTLTLSRSSTTHIALDGYLSVISIITDNFWKI